MNKQESAKALKNLAGAVDDILKELNGGERLGFAILIFPFDKDYDPEKDHKKRVNYISNAQRKHMIEALRATLLRWESGTDDREHGINPSHN